MKQTKTAHHSKAKQNTFYLAYGALLLATTIWAAATPIIKLTLEEIPLFSFLFYRFLIVCICIFPFLALELKKRPIAFKDLPTLIILGLAGQTGILFIFWGIKYTSAIDTGIIGAIGPLMIIMAGHYFYNDKINRALEVGLLVATLGTIIVVLEPLLASLQHQNMLTNTTLVQDAALIPQDSNIFLRIFGNLLVVMYNAVFAIYIILSKAVMGSKSTRVKHMLSKIKLKPLSKRYSPFVHTSFSFFVALASFIPLVILETLGVFGDEAFSIYDVSLTGYTGLLYMALISSIVAYLAFQWGLERAKVSDSGVFAYLNTVFTIPFAFLILGEIPNSISLIGAAVVATGVIIAEYRKH